ncbi:beta-lactamase-like protein [Podospora conica]|nr:beta-lactamase-like protein [Schizothecium conicum]
MSALEPIIHTCFEPRTSTWQYVVADPSTKSAVIIDSVLDFDPSTSTISTETADALLSLVKENGYTVQHILETHVHADHLTASRYLQQQLEKTNADHTKPAICIGKRIHSVQERFARRYGIDKAEYEGAFDHLIDDDEIFPLGKLQVKAIHLPGHTPDHMGYMVGANVFCGDSLFNTDVGSARCDFPDGDAHELYASAAKLFSLPPATKIYTGHDYPPDGRQEPRAYTTVAEQREDNKHLKAGTSEAEFVAWRQGRDAGLAEPRLLHQALQFNIRAGRLPGVRGKGFGDRLLHVPVKVKGGRSW